MFDAASGFGGYRESGFGREGGREGLREYVKWAADGRRTGGQGGRTAVGRRRKASATTSGREPARPTARPPARPPPPAIDRTPKLYIGGKQARPDSGYSLPVLDAAGGRIGEVGHGNRKDIRNAVEAAHKAPGWVATRPRTTGPRCCTTSPRISPRGRTSSPAGWRSSAATPAAAEREVALSIERIYTYAAWADKYDGRVHHTPFRNVTLAMPEPIGVVGVVCPDALAAARFRLDRAAGDRDGQHGGRGPVRPRGRSPRPTSTRCSTRRTCPAAWSTSSPACATSWPPVLAAHDDVDGLWYFGTRRGVGGGRAAVGGQHEADLGGLRPGARLGRSAARGEGEEFLEQATQVKNIWVPYGE